MCYFCEVMRGDVQFVCVEQNFVLFFYMLREKLGKFLYIRCNIFKVNIIQNSYCF